MHKLIARFAFALVLSTATQLAFVDVCQATTGGGIYFTTSFDQKVADTINAALSGYSEFRVDTSHIYVGDASPSFGRGRRGSYWFVVFLEDTDDGHVDWSGLRIVGEARLRDDGLDVHDSWIEYDDGEVLETLRGKYSLQFQEWYFGPW